MKTHWELILIKTTPRACEAGNSVLTKDTKLTNRDGRGGHCCSMRGVRRHCHGDNSVIGHLGMWDSTLT